VWPLTPLVNRSSPIRPALPSIVLSSSGGSMPPRAGAAAATGTFPVGPCCGDSTRWLYAVCWSETDQPRLLCDQAKAWLIANKVLLPGASVLERLVAGVRTRVQKRLWRALVRGLNVESQARLDTLLNVPAGQRRSALDHL
jgi:Domain of unknown function (DUF4158)